MYFIDPNDAVSQIDFGADMYITYHIWAIYSLKLLSYKWLIVITYNSFFFVLYQPFMLSIWTAIYD